MSNSFQAGEKGLTCFLVLDRFARDVSANPPAQLVISPFGPVQDNSVEGSITRAPHIWNFSNSLKSKFSNSLRFNQVL